MSLNKIFKLAVKFKKYAEDEESILQKEIDKLYFLNRRIKQLEYPIILKGNYFTEESLLDIYSPLQNDVRYPPVNLTLDEYKTRLAKCLKILKSQAEVLEKDGINTQHSTYNLVKANIKYLDDNLIDGLTLSKVPKNILIIDKFKKPTNKFWIGKNQIIIRERVSRYITIFDEMEYDDETLQLDMEFVNTKQQIDTAKKLSDLAVKILQEHNFSK